MQNEMIHKSRCIKAKPNIRDPKKTALPLKLQTCSFCWSPQLHEPERAAFAEDKTDNCDAEDS